jgi:hypothetical protein
MAYGWRAASAHREQLSHQIGCISAAMADGYSTEEPALLPGSARAAGLPSS